MSAEDFRKLSLGAGDMVTTRAGARARTAPAPARHSDSSSESAESSDESPSPSPKIITSNTGIRYNISHLDEAASQQAQRALKREEKPRLRVEICGQGGNDGGVTFHIEDQDINVTIGGNYHVPSCSCGMNEGDRGCKHIFWLIDQITTLTPDSFRLQDLSLESDGSAVQGIALTQMIDKLKMDHIREQLHWVLHDGAENVGKDIIADMLSVFEPSGAFPKEFRIMSETTNVDERSWKYKQFADMITDYAAEHPGMLARLQEILDPRFQAHIFFGKVDERTTNIFQALDDYVRNGPGDYPSYDVEHCAAALRDLVKSIDSFCKQQESEVEPPIEMAISAARALTSILKRVSYMDHNQVPTWRSSPPTHATENNLFERLIRAAPEDESPFVLEVLKGVPPDNVLRLLSDDLYEIEKKLVENGTPADYLDEFRSILPENRKRSYPEVEGSSSKRVAI